MSDYLLVRAILHEKMAADAPQLDSLLEWTLAIHHPKADPGYKVDRRFPAPAQGVIPIPLARRWVAVRNGKVRVVPFCHGELPPRFATDSQVHLIAMASDPIVGIADSEGVEYVNKRLCTENAGLLAPTSRLVVSTTNSWTKSYRLPLAVRSITEVRWFALGNRRGLKKALAGVDALSKKRSVGYGRIREWIIERLDIPPSPDWPWWMDTEHGRLLMRTLPEGLASPDLVGLRKDFGAACPPYWHPSRYCELIKPC